MKLGPKPSKKERQMHSRIGVKIMLRISKYYEFTNPELYADIQEWAAHTTRQLARERVVHET